MYVEDLFCPVPVCVASDCQNQVFPDLPRRQERGCFYWRWQFVPLSSYFLTAHFLKEDDTRARRCYAKFWNLLSLHSKSWSCRWFSFDFHRLTLFLIGNPMLIVSFVLIVLIGLQRWSQIFIGFLWVLPSFVGFHRYSCYLLFLIQLNLLSFVCIGVHWFYWRSWVLIDHIELFGSHCFW